MDKPDINRLIELQKFLLQFSQVERITHRQRQGSFIQENDTEHSYNLAITAWYLARYFPQLNRDLLIRLALVHDLVEVHAGDTYIYADEAIKATKEAREKAALEKLNQDWQDFPEMLDALHAYEQKETAEAKFIYALDKIMPIMLIYIGDGHTWHREGTTLERLHSVKSPKVELSPDIKPYYDQLYDLLRKAPHIIPAS